MKTEYREKLIEALESGDYDQTTGMLRCDVNSRPSFCCLGVMCDLHDPAGWKGSEGDDVHMMGGSYISDYVRYEVLGEFPDDYYVNSTELPPPLLHTFGMTDDEVRTLITYNDNGKTFREIAQELRTNPLFQKEKGA
jgi:hypothetical protein